MTARRYVLKAFGFFLAADRSGIAAVPPRNILFIRVDRIGDMALSTPAFQAIKAAFPSAQLTVMASKMNSPLLKNNPHVDNVIVYDRSDSLINRIRLLKRLRKRHFDLAVDPCDDNELETAWIAWMSAAPYRIGYAAFGREVLLNASAQKSKKYKHFIDVTLDLLKLTGGSFDNSWRPALYIDQTEQAWAMEWINGKRLPEDKPIIGIHPGAYYETQRWPPEYFADLIGLIRERKAAEVIVFGGPSDADLIANIQATAKEPFCKSIHKDIRHFLVLLSRCRMLISNNSGPLHCAVALNVPTVSFMGPTVKERWAPIGNMHHILRMDDLPCIGCNLGYCKIKTHDCMRLIRPGNVLDLINGILVSGK